MPRPSFDAALINALRQRVVAHNEAGGKVRLQELKKIYVAAHRGRNPPVAALAAVDAHLEKLAKGWFSSDHPRDARGEFADRGGGQPDLVMPLPATVQAHRDLQAANAGYRALTSDLLPEHRYESIGAAVRDGLSAAAGLGLVAAMARGRPNNLAVMLGRGLGRATGRFLGGVGSGVPAHVAAAALKRANARGWSRFTMTEDGPGAIAASGAALGGRLGAKLGTSAAQGATYTVHSAVKLAGKLAGKDAPAYRRRAHQAAAIAALASVPAAAIRERWRDSQLDPAAVGRGIDNFGYRSIEKMARLPALAEAHAALRKFGPGNEGDLRKAMSSRLYGRVGGAVVAGLASLAGAAVGAGAGAAAGRGNPYHDSRGRFTSHAGAVGGAVAGAALSGLAAYIALRRHNRAAFRAAYEASSALADRLADRAKRGGAYYGRAARMQRNQTARVVELMGGDSELAQKTTELDRYGASAPLHFKEQIRQEVNGHLANTLSQIDAFKVPVREDGKTAWKTMAEVRAGEPSKSRRATAAQRAALDAIDAMTPKTFAEAVADLPPAAQKNAMTMFLARGAAIGNVDSDIAKHAAAIDAAKIVVQAAVAKHAAAKQAADDAFAIASTADEAGKPAAEAARAAALEAAAKAAKAVKAAEDKHLKLQHAPSPVVSPVTGQPIPPPSPIQQQAVRARLKMDAENRAKARVKLEIARAREQEATRVAERANQVLAAQAALGRAAGAVPRNAKAAAAAAADAHGAAKAARTALAAAERRSAAAQGPLRSLEAAEKYVAGNGKRPPKLTDQEIQQIQANTSAIRGEATAAQTAAAEARSRHDLARVRLNSAAADFAAAMRGEGGSAPKSRSAHWLSAEVTRDLRRATGRMTGPVKSLLRKPTSAALNRFATALATGARKAGGVVRHQSIGVMRELFMREVPGANGGAPRYVIDPAKVLTRGVFLGLAGEGLRDTANFAREQVFGPRPGQRRGQHPGRARLEHEIDPVTGAGFVALTLPHPERRDDRVVLWGQRIAAAQQATRDLHAGGSLSAVRGAIRAQIDRQRNQQQPGVPGSAAPTSFAFRGDVDSSGNEEAGKVMQAYRQKFVNSGALSGGLYYTALGHLFSDDVGKKLKASQAFSLLTGYKANGEGGGVGVFGRDEGFKGADTTGAALSREVDRAIKDRTLSAQDRQLLHHAVGTVAAVRSLPAETVSAIRAKIGGEAPRPAAEVPQAKPAQPEPKPAQTVRQPRPEPVPEGPAEMPAAWDQMTLREEADSHSARLAPTLGIRTENGRLGLTTFIEVMARHVHRMFPAMDEAGATRIVARAVHNLAAGGSVNAKLAADAIRNVDPAFFLAEIRRQAQTDGNLDKSADAALDALLKSFNEDEARIAAGMAGGGEWTSGGPSTASKAATEVAATGSELAAKNAMRTKSRTPQAFYHPVRVANELGAAAGGDLANYGAHLGIEALVEKFLPGELGITAKIGVGAAKLAAGVPVLAAGAAAGQAAGDAAARGGYAAVGRKAPAYQAPEYHSVGEAGADLAGNVAGMAAGGAVAGRLIGGAGGSFLGPIGTVVGGTLGSYAGSLIARGAYDYFAGYDRPTVQRAMARYAPQPQGAAA